MIQTCPACGRTEAAGAYCTACFRAIAPGEWSADDRASASRTTPTEPPRRPRAGGPPVRSTIDPTDVPVVP